MVFQNLLGAHRDSLSNASQNSFHIWAFSPAVPPFDCWCSSTASGVLPGNKAQCDSFFSFTASLTQTLHHWVQGWPPWEPLTTLQQLLKAAASTTEVRNMAYSDSMFPASVGMWLKFSLRCELKIYLKGSSAKRFQQILTTHLGLSGLSNIFPRHLIQLTTRNHKKLKTISNVTSSTVSQQFQGKIIQHKLWLCQNCSNIKILVQSCKVELSVTRLNFEWWFCCEVWALKLQTAPEFFMFHCNHIFLHYLFCQIFFNFL